MIPFTAAICMLFMTLSVAVVSQWNALALIPISTALKFKSSNNNNMELIKRDVDYNKKATEDGNGIFFTIAQFFGHRKNTDDDKKPEFITTFDIIRLLDEQYAMKQFFCVINEDPCDEVGLRLKASIPEELNRNCERCTTTEKNNIRRILNYVKKHYPKFWSQVEPIYKKKMVSYVK